MTHDEAVNILKNYQLWRRGLPPYDFGQPVNMPFTPEKLGEALDYAIAELTRENKDTQFDERIALVNGLLSQDCIGKGIASLIRDMQSHIRKLEANPKWNRDV